MEDEFPERRIPKAFRPRVKKTGASYELRVRGTIDLVQFWALVMIGVLSSIFGAHFWGIFGLGYWEELLAWAVVAAVLGPPWFWSGKFRLERGKIEINRYYLGIRIFRIRVFFDRVEALHYEHSILLYKNGKLTGVFLNDIYIEDHAMIILTKHGRWFRWKVKMDWFEEDNYLDRRILNFIRDELQMEVWYIEK